MKQLSGLLLKLAENKSSEYLMRGSRIDCPMTKLGGSIAVKSKSTYPEPVSWLSYANLSLLSKGAEIRIRAGQHYITSKEGAHVPCKLVAEYTAPSAEHATKFAVTDNFDAQAELSLTTEAQRQRFLVLLEFPSTDDNRYIFSGVHFRYNTAEPFKFWATDGRVAAELAIPGVSVTIHGDSPTPCTVPSTALKRFLAFKNTVYRIMWNASMYRIEFELDGYVVTYEDKLLEGVFPDLRRVAPAATHRIPFDCAKFAAVKWLRNPPSNPVTVRIEPSAEGYYSFTQYDADGNIICMHSNGGASDPTRPYIKCGVNHEYMTSAAKLCGPDATLEVVFEVDVNTGAIIDNDKYGKPLLLKATDCMALVMPMRI